MVWPTTMDKSALCRLVRIDWDTTGRIIERVMATGLDPKRLDNLFVCGVDEVCWRKGHSYLTLVSNNDIGRFIWGAEGKDTATLDCSSMNWAKRRSGHHRHVDGHGPAFEKSARKEGHATKAVICFDPFHVVQAATKALETVRRQVWQDLRTLPDKEVARRFKGARWCLLKNPDSLTDDQAVTLRKMKRRGGDLWRAYALKEALREIFAGDLTEDEVAILLDRFCSRAQRSGLKPFVTLAQTIRKRREGILAAVKTRREQRQARGAQPAGPPHHQSGLRIPLRQRRPRPHHGHARTDRPTSSPTSVSPLQTPESTHIHAGRLAKASSPMWQSALVRWTSRRRRLAVKPISRSAGRLWSRLPTPKSRVSLMVVSVRRAWPRLWYCLIRVCL